MESIKVRKFTGARSYKISKSIASALRDIYRTAQLIQLPRESIQARVNNATYDSPEYQRLLNADKAYLRGYHDALQSALEQSLVWVKYLDGKYYTTAALNQMTAAELLLPVSKEKDYRSPWIRVAADKGVFVYRDMNGEPMMDKVWA